MHGSDRPGGNNLIDTQVFGCRAGRGASEFALSVRGKTSAVPRNFRADAVACAGCRIRAATAALYERELTIVRRAEGLKKVLEFIADQAPASYAERNALLVGRILATAALTREESRGTHYREDFPDTDPAAKYRIIIRRGSNGEPEVLCLGR